MPDRAGAVLSDPHADAAELAAPLDPDTLVDPLLAWSRQHLRDLPWRRTRDPWAILVSEVMLQQTQVSRVAEHWTEFLERFPTAVACAEAAPGDVIALWAGLGYNRRAVNLWRAAVEIRDRFGGDLPADIDALQSLPGIGPYTARAVAVFAFARAHGVVDTNVGRLLARWAGEPQTPARAQALADQLVPAGEAWRWNQTLFDFAVQVCTKRSPACGSCPITAACSWQGIGDDPAGRSAGVSSRQTAFEGSVRQVRGRILDAVRSGPVTFAEAARFARPGDTAGDLDGIVAGLIADGLIARQGDVLVLPT